MDIKSAFLQTGLAERDVYVVPPRECSRRRFLCLLLTAAYGLVNANAKWQEHSDSTLHDLGFSQLVHVPQLFYRKVSGTTESLAVKVVDDILVCGQKTHLDQFVHNISAKYTVGTIVRGPGTLSFFGLTIVQDVDGTIQVSGDEKFAALKAHPLLRARRKQFEDSLNAAEQFSYNSLNESVSFIGYTTSPFCSFISSHLQQRCVSPLVKDLVVQWNILRQVQDLGSTVTFKRPSAPGTYELKVVVFPDAARGNEHGKLAFVAGLVLGDVSRGSVLHTLAWSSHNSKRPTKFCRCC